MLLTVSTVKDSVPALQQFTERNLASGVDHMLLFVDDGDTEVADQLSALPHVTAIPTGPGWWHGKRPARLNIRQRINANVARALLAPQEWASWLFHIDSDECLQVDRAALGRLPPRVGTVRAETWEAVSRRRWPGGRVTHFKRKLDDDQLALLQVLGVIDVAHNGAYFHGHVDGKSGIRPVMHRWLGLHTATDVTGKRIPGRPEVARVLHYESWSGQEFVRKWDAMLSSGGTVRLRPIREPVARALRALGALELSEKQRRARLMEIYARTTEDDFTTLRDLGLLVEVDPMTGTHRPEALGPERGATLEAMLAALRPENKWPFETGATAAAMLETLGRVAARLDEVDGPLAERARRTWVLDGEVLAAAATPGARRDPDDLDGQDEDDGPEESDGSEGSDGAAQGSA